MQLSAPDKLLWDRVQDLVEAAQQRYQCRYTFFLDERQQALAEAFAKKLNFTNYSLFGGYDSAQRRVFGVFEQFTQPDPGLFPIGAVTCRFPAFRKLSHRDFLGSLMALGVTRESVGDILLGEGYAVFFLTQPAQSLVLSELKKVSSLGVRLEEGVREPLPAPFRLQPVQGTVSSMRLDCVAAFLCGKSREKTAQMIRSGLVSVNHLPEEQVSRLLEAGDILVIRGVGKFRIEESGGLSKKGKLRLCCSKYV